MSVIARDAAFIKPVVKPPAPPKPRKPAARGIKIIEPAAADTDGWMALRITSGKEATVYLVQPFAADWGRGFSVEKLDADLNTIEQYDVNVCGQQSSCTCPGFTFHSHCRHVEGLLALDKAGRLPAKQKHAACPSCHAPADGGQLCERCTEEEDDFAAYHQAAEMEAGGLDPWAECGEDRYTVATDDASDLPMIDPPDAA